MSQGYLRCTHLWVCHVGTQSPSQALLSSALAGMWAGLSSSARPFGLSWAETEPGELIPAQFMATRFGPSSRSISGGLALAVATPASSFSPPGTPPPSALPARLLHFHLLKFPHNEASLKYLKLRLFFPAFPTQCTGALLLTAF